MQYAEGKTWRDEITPDLQAMGVTVFDPYEKPFINAPEEDANIHKSLQRKMLDGQLDDVASHMKQIRRVDLSMVDRADFLIFYINPTVPTFGTIEELVTAVRAKKPIFMVVEGGKSRTPFWIMGMLPHKYIYDNMAEVISMLNKIHVGEIDIDSERWRLLRYELR